jgi:hypothetical protein
LPSVILTMIADGDGTEAAAASEVATSLIMTLIWFKL